METFFMGSDLKRKTHQVSCRSDSALGQCFSWPYSSLWGTNKSTKKWEEGRNRVWGGRFAASEVHRLNKKAKRKHPPQ
ncbi:mCG140267 [Mus musculus]|nr:mCG140267 [Mus musculus]